MKRFLFSIANILLKITLWPFLKKDMTGSLLQNLVCNYIQENTCNFCTYKLRPKNADAVVSSDIESRTDYGEFAIVLQGLIETSNDFTYQSVLYYQKLYPGVHIIISTWDYTDKQLIERFKTIGCEIVLSKDIPVCGMGNVNYQICTSLAGIRCAKEIGATYVLKNRCDLRLYKDGALNFMKGLLANYPVKTDNKYGLKGRIITQGGNPGQMFIPYWLQDFMYFGYTDDLLNLFEIKFSGQAIHSAPKYLRAKYDFVTGDTLREEQTPEIYITKSFLEKYEDLPYSVSHFWQLVREIFLFVDPDTIGSFWGKYNIFNMGWLQCEYDGKECFSDANRHIGFVDFVNIYNGEYKYEPWMETKSKDYIVF